MTRSDAVTFCRECGGPSHGHPFCAICHERWRHQQATGSRGTCLACGQPCRPTMKRCQRCHDQLKSRLVQEHSNQLDKLPREAEGRQAVEEPQGRYVVTCACGCGAVVRVSRPKPGLYYAEGHAQPRGRGSRRAEGGASGPPQSPFFPR